MNKLSNLLDIVGGKTTDDAYTIAGLARLCQNLALENLALTIENDLLKTELENLKDYGPVIF